MTDMTGKTAIITGASRGIGAATARIFADAGANVVLLARSGGDIYTLAAEIGPKALAISCDISDFEEVESAVSAGVDKFGRIDILIGNAGVIEPISALSEADPEGWGAAIDINLKGIFYGMRAVMPGMIAQGSGTIITISSGAAHHPLEGWSHYCASKAGAAMLTSCAHLEGQAHGLRVMGLSPGTVATEMQREIKASGIGPVAKLEWSDHVPAEWPARTLLWMCSKDADAFKGQEIALRDESIRKRVGLI
jgi:NAD(P)-dependent dehydrogenase (short-subunit alcohol dehydrogenase family)